MSISDEDRNRLLSPEEIAAMEEDDEYNAEEDNAAALAEIGRGPIDSDEEDDDDDEQDGKAGKDKPDDAAAGKTKDESGGETVDPAKKEEEQQQQAQEQEQASGASTTAAAPAPAPEQKGGYKADLPADFDDKLKANRAARSELRKKLNDGEMDADEYDAKLTELEDERDDLSRQKTRAEIASEMQAQAAQNEWISTINTFLADAAAKPELGLVDYKKDEAKQADLDTFVKALAAIPANADKPGRWFLEEGHKRVLALHGIEVKKAGKEPEKKPDLKRTPNVDDVVTTLAGVPGGNGDGDPVGDEFAELDKLTGLEYERELAKLSPEKRQKYEMSA